MIKVAEIGIFADAEKYVGPGDLMMLSKRESKGHKGDSGKILVIGGGPYSGAPTFAGLAALKSGADLVTVTVPMSAAETVASYSPNMIPDNSKKRYVNCLQPGKDIHSLKEIFKGRVPRIKKVSCMATASYVIKDNSRNVHIWIEVFVSVDECST